MESGSRRTSRLAAFEISAAIASNVESVGNCTNMFSLDPRALWMYSRITQQRESSVSASMPKWLGIHRSLKSLDSSFRRNFSTISSTTPWSTCSVGAGIMANTKFTMSVTGPGGPYAANALLSHRSECCSKDTFSPSGHTYSILRSFAAASSSNPKMPKMRSKCSLCSQPFSKCLPRNASHASRSGTSAGVKTSNSFAKLSTLSMAAFWPSARVGSSLAALIISWTFTILACTKVFSLSFGMVRANSSARLLISGFLNMLIAALGMLGPNTGTSIGVRELSRSIF
mmetsp:Transcript_114815/g.325691  ORF Transcript_114815/g.325691 Transcript_114815/m.325691 type:complete len:285 (+) Transcript_114815:359-1213(+)